MIWGEVLYNCVVYDAMGISEKKVISKNQVLWPSVSVPGLKAINQCYKVITILIIHAWDRSQLNPTYTLYLGNLCY